MNVDVFEEHYSDIMNEELSIEIRGDIILVSYNENGTIRTSTINKNTYLRDVRNTNYYQRLTINGVFMQDRLNCFVEAGILYLDPDIPLSFRSHPAPGTARPEAACF